MNELIKLIGLGLAVGGLIVAAKSFTTELETVEKKGLTLAGGVALVGLGATVMLKSEDAKNRADAIFG